MPSSQIERKLAAIMFTDIAGYTAQMSKDEAVAISLLNKKESVLKPLITKHNGTYVKSTGDGSLSHFNSAVDAATCAKRFQESIYDDKNLNVRVGVHLGETIFEKGDIRGDGVNIASRLESMAVEGGVFVSKEVHDQLANQKEFEGVSLGLQSMKGVGRLIEVYGLKGDMLNEPSLEDYTDSKIKTHSDKEVPSIAIIPFDNKGADEDIFYAYGISADLISDMSSAGLIRVPSLKRVEEVADLNLDEKATKLDVRYTVEGTLWKMDDVFQLSVELYDTKDKKVVWSDRWQEDWDNLPAIKMNLSDGLLKALDTKNNVEKRVDSSNAEAYEYYLKGKYKYQKRSNIEDMEIAKGLLEKSFELDNNIILAKTFLGWINYESGDYNKAMEIYMPALKQAEKLHDKRAMGACFNGIAVIYHEKGDLETALDYHNRALNVSEEIGDKRGVASSIGNIGNVYSDKGNYDRGLDYHNRALKLKEEINYKAGIGSTLNNIGYYYYYNGEYARALDYHKRALNIRKECNHKHGIGWSFRNIGFMHYYIGDYDKAEKNLETALCIQKELGLGADNLIWTTTYLSLIYKKLGKKYDKKQLHTLIEAKVVDEYEVINDELNFILYQLLDKKSYLETAYNQVQETADAMEDKFKAKFLSYPIPKAIVEEWEKVLQQ